MKKLQIISFVLLLLISTSQCFASQTELRLWKRHQYTYGSCGDCAMFTCFHGGNDSWDFSEFSHYYQDGYYTVNLSGPAGTAVTLYGARNFNEERGFMVIVKKDDRLIEVEELESFPNEKWSTVSATEDNGAYDIFYKSYPRFSRNIGSIAWKNIVN